MKQQHGNQGVSRFQKNSPHGKGIIRSQRDQIELEKVDRENKNCSVVKLACDDFFTRRGLDINVPIDPPRWDMDLVNSAGMG
tara:strand:+ start:14820 stop:15065 length:246 start_codon:yes stop_codon:yes gene_type:complete